MVLNNYGDKLYFGLVATITYNLKEIASSIEATQGDSFLEELNSKWNHHHKSLEHIRAIVMYMERIYVQKAEKKPIYELGLNLWTENVICSEQIKTRLSNTLLDLVRKDRAGEDVNKELIRNITKMLMDLGSSVYDQEFESQKFIESCDCGDYLKKVEMCLNEEMDRVCQYLDASTEKKVTNVVEKEMIANYTLRLIDMENSGLVNMLCDDKYEDLGRMYNLFCRVNDGFYKIFEVMISQVGKSIKELVTQLERSDDPSEFRQRLLDEKDKYKKILNLAFNNDKIFQYALNHSFKCLTNF
jgi:cullin 3